MSKNILIVEPFFTGSHAQWAKGYKKYSRHNISFLKLPGRYWKWRMHGAAVTLSTLFKSESVLPDVILATDMLDTAGFLALNRKLIGDIPVVTYFHENQVNYPWSDRDTDSSAGRDVHYSFINYMSCMASDNLLFNSHYHQESFLSGLKSIFKKFPDFPNYSTLSDIKQKSFVIYPGIDCKKLKVPSAKLKKTTLPIILWNHRWEYDKNPEDFFRILLEIKKSGIPFKLVILGEKFSHSPDIFLRAESLFQEEIIHFGYCANYSDYAQWLHRSTVLPVTSNQDFFGLSIVEAMYCGVQPILPVRLSYPELIPEQFHSNYLYSSEEVLIQKLKNILLMRNSEDAETCRMFGQKFSWEIIAKEMDNFLQSIL